MSEGVVPPTAFYYHSKQTSPSSRTLDEYGKSLYKTHPRYQLFNPATRWESRLRNLMYVRRDPSAYSLLQPASPDIAAINIAGLTIIDVFRHPHGHATLLGLTQLFLH